MAPRQTPTTLVHFVTTARRGVLATIRRDGRPRQVPICFVLDEQVEAAGQDGIAGAPMVLYSAIDEKPKDSTDPMRLARVRDILERPFATVLIDRWDEEWDRLAWVRCDCRAELLPSNGGDPGERGRAIAALRAKYPQYQGHRLEERPLLRLSCTIGAAWGDLTTGADGEEPSAEAEPDVEAM